MARTSTVTFYDNGGQISSDLQTPSTIKRTGFKNKLLQSLQSADRAIFAITTSIYNPNIDVYEINESGRDLTRKTITIHESEAPPLPSRSSMPEPDPNDETFRNLEQYYNNVFMAHYRNYPPS